jgi:histone-lysine N-methyltransferase SETD2
MSTVKAEDGEHLSAAKENPKIEEPAKMSGVIPKKERRSESSTPAGSHINSRASSVSHDDVKAGSDSASTPSNSSAPRLSRKASQKNVKLTARVFDHLPDATTESCLTFQVINDCLYGSKHMGSSEHDALDCDCTEEWRK